MTVVPLASAGPECGGKAAALGTLLRAGLPVPDGFVVTAPDTPLPPLPENRVFAVRSSAPHEDGTEASFAGQFETVLGVRAGDVAAAVRRCAASGGSARVRAYRGHGVGPIPVLVQEMVAADRAGVLFTSDPRTGAKEVVINASWGLGEPVVAGTVTPDEITGGRVVVGRKAVRLDLTGAGPVLSPVPPSDREICCLDGAEIALLEALGGRCAEVFGRPQDVEWALVRDRAWVLQSRPITAFGGGAGPASGAALITATPSSPGRVTGAARLIRSRDEFHRLRPGEILVCRTTDPAWTPLFRVAAGVITETGGILSHAAIVAREFRVPAVTGADRALNLIQDGQTIALDGAAGTVHAEGQS